MDTHTDAPGVAPPEAISTALETGSNERGTEIVAHSGTNANFERIAEINSEHRLATHCAQDAVQHAIRCGHALTKQKKDLLHGEFSKWIATNCEFAYSTAARYMTAAKQISQGVEISSLSALFPSGRKTTKKTISKEEMVAATDAETAEKKTAPAALMSGAPSIASQPPELPRVGVEVALRALRAASLAREIPVPRCIANLSADRGRVTKLRNDLARAELDLVETEKQLLEAYREFKARKAAP